jgi:hypothetical protein
VAACCNSPSPVHLGVKATSLDPMSTAPCLYRRRRRHAVPCEEIPRSHSRRRSRRHSRKIYGCRNCQYFFQSQRWFVIPKVFIFHRWGLSMSLEHAPQRQTRTGPSSKVSLTTSPPGPIAFTVAEFCKAHRISRSFLYSEWKAGRGPRFMRAGVKRIITGEAAADWRHECEAEAAAENRGAER